MEAEAVLFSTINNPLAYKNALASIKIKI